MSKSFGFSVIFSFSIKTDKNRNIFMNFMCFEFLQIFLVKLEVDSS